MGWRRAGTGAGGLVPQALEGAREGVRTERTEERASSTSCAASMSNTRDTCSRCKAVDATFISTRIISVVFYSFYNGIKTWPGCNCTNCSTFSAEKSPVVSIQSAADDS